MMATSRRLSLRLPAEPESIPRARAAVAALAEEAGMAAPNVGDLKLVVSEACTNVVRHAYPHGGGEFELRACPQDEEVKVVVRDFGQGIRPTLRQDSGTFQLGIGLMSALSSHFEIDAGGDAGTRVTLEIPLG
jgi:anti-sigma regulatory factor (Ser/Thr protein kinase)